LGVPRPPLESADELDHQPGSLVALATLTVLEIVLGIDNIVFISILSTKRARAAGESPSAGLAIAMLTRIALLFRSSG
jgi:predicted tellurium resistance membrane protein TerC